MKSFFYGISSFILTLFLISYLTFLFTEKTYYEFPKEQTGLVIHKRTTAIFGHETYILHADSTIGSFSCYDILFNNLEVGDSIINGEIRRN